MEILQIMKLIMGDPRMSRKIDETGNRYGKLVVLQEAKTKNPTGGCMWICKCDCGKLVLADGHELRRGKKKSCGCLNNIIDEIGKKYGKLTVIKYAGLNNRGQALWQCKCDCGNTTIVMGINLRNGNSQSCGCLKSKGELKISKLLLKYNIPFQREKKFETCRYDKTNQLAKFDFYINSKYIIEYDGIQHFDFSKGEKTWNTKQKSRKKPSF